MHFMCNTMHKKCTAVLSVDLQLNENQTPEGYCNAVVILGLFASRSKKSGSPA